MDQKKIAFIQGAEKNWNSSDSFIGWSADLYGGVLSAFVPLQTFARYNYGSRNQ